MSQAVLFSSKNALDFEEIRLNVVRIPEVVARIRLAQRVWDRLNLPHLDLHNFILSEDQYFLANTRLKRLAVSIVQIGLFDRFIAKHEHPKYLISNIANEATLLCCVGLVHFKDIIEKSDVVRGHKGLELVNSSSDDERYFVVYEGKNNKENKKFFLLDEYQNKELKYIIRQLSEKKSNRHFINIGPNPLTQRLRKDFELDDLVFSEAMDMDPMLDWFWNSLSNFQEISAAQ